MGVGSRKGAGDGEDRSGDGVVPSELSPSQIKHVDGPDRVTWESSSTISQVLGRLESHTVLVNDPEVTVRVCREMEGKRREGNRLLFSLQLNSNILNTTFWSPIRFYSSNTPIPSEQSN